MEKENKKMVSLAGIPYSEVYAMVQTYHDHAAKQPGFDYHQHVRCVWFPVDQILTLAEKLRTEPGADGLRVYFGRYPTDVSEFENPLPKPDTNSVILVSTRVNDKGVPRCDYFSDMPMVPENRGEQCQPHCGGTDDGLNFDPVP